MEIWDLVQHISQFRSDFGISCTLQTEMCKGTSKVHEKIELKDSRKAKIV